MGHSVSGSRKLVCCRPEGAALSVFFENIKKYQLFFITAIDFEHHRLTDLLFLCLKSQLSVMQLQTYDDLMQKILCK